MKVNEKRKKTHNESQTTIPTLASMVTPQQTSPLFSNGAWPALVFKVNYAQHLHTPTRSRHFFLIKHAWELCSFVLEIEKKGPVPYNAPKGQGSHPRTQIDTHHKHWHSAGRPPHNFLQNICSAQCFNRKMLFVTSTSHFSKTTIHVTCQIPQDKKVH